MVAKPRLKRSGKRLFSFAFRRKSALVVPSTIRVLMPDGSVSVMELEDYLKGVVPVEIGWGNPTEALKAQAVAARSYAATSHSHSAQGADICTTQHCQAWRSTHYATTDAAVDQTKGQVAVYGGEIVRCYYFAHCDGHTRDVGDVWGRDLPYLVSVSCICGYTTLYGHGVGMCQRGAMAMARAGSTYVDILKHYYSGIDVSGEQTQQPPDTESRQAAIAKFLVGNPDTAKFIGASVPGGFAAADGNWIEFFEAGALAVRPDANVSLQPMGAWIAGEYADRQDTLSRPFLDAVAKPGVDGRYIDATKHNLARFFLRHWQSTWGNPVSEEFYLVVDGVPMTHQMFEYALISHDPYTNEPLRSMRLTEIFLSAFDGGQGLDLLGQYVP
ncbi:MAG: SpoIID/LytB domain-containing protein [Anaerolineae bacterium]